MKKTLIVSEELHKQLKLLAVKNGEELNKLVERLLRDALQREEGV